MSIQNNRIKFLGMLFTGLLMQLSAAANASNSLAHGKFAFQLGAAYTHAGKPGHIGINTLIGDNLSVTSHNDIKPLIGFGYYVNGSNYSLADMQYGLNAFYIPDAGVGGNVTQENTFNNLSYGYNITNIPILLDAKAELHTRHPSVTPTFDIGLGPNFLQTSNFTEHSLDGGVTVPDNILQGSTKLTLAATIGIGMKFNNVKIYRDSPLECGYRFFYFGQGNLSRSSNQVTNTIKTGNDYANTLLCSVAI